MKGYHVVALVLLILLVFAGSASAQSNEGLDINQTNDDLAVNIDLNVSKTNHDSLEAANEDIVADGASGEIIVEKWDDLQYYCSLDDKDYTLKLKEILQMLRIPIIKSTLRIMFILLVLKVHTLEMFHLMRVKLPILLFR